MKYLVDRIQLWSKTTFLSVYFNFSNDEKPQSVFQPWLLWLSCHFLFQGEDEKSLFLQQEKCECHILASTVLWGLEPWENVTSTHFCLNADRLIRKACWDLCLRQWEKKRSWDHERSGLGQREPIWKRLAPQYMRTCNTQHVVGLGWCIGML